MECFLRLHALQANMTTNVRSQEAYRQITCGKFARTERYQLLHSVSGRFRAGHMTIVLGPSGAGKSMVLQVRCLLSTPCLAGALNRFIASSSCKVRCAGAYLMTQMSPPCGTRCTVGTSHRAVLQCDMQACCGVAPAPVAISGSITLNGQPLGACGVHRTARYIDGRDQHLGSLTVRETLVFAAMVQGPRFSPGASPCCGPAARARARPWLPRS